MRSFRVQSAEDGVEYTVLLQQPEMSLAMFKQKVAQYTTVPPSHQVLLVGPPYQHLDTVFDDLIVNGPQQQGQQGMSSVERSGTAAGAVGASAPSQHIFLYNRRLFAPDGSGPSLTQRVPLKPETLEVPDPPEASSAVKGLLEDSESTNPLHNTLLDYDRQFLHLLQKGQSFFQQSEQALESCNTCVRQLSIQRHALQAAVTNLGAHFDAMKLAFAPASDELRAQQEEHARLLTNFATHLERLKSIQLHPAFQSEAEGRMTLWDCVPADREEQWQARCQEAYDRVKQWFSHFSTIVDEVEEGVAQLTQKHTDEAVQRYRADLHEKLEQARDACRQQNERLFQLQNTYNHVFDNLKTMLQRVKTDSSAGGGSGAASAAGGTGDGQQQSEFIFSALKRLEEMRKEFEEQAVTPLEEDARNIMAVKHTLSEARDALGAELVADLQVVSALQHKAHYLNLQVPQIRQTVSHQHADFTHLEHVLVLPDAYHALIAEIARRNAFTESFEGGAQSAAQRFTKMRAAETQLRQQFMREYGVHLPPVLVQHVPSLKEKPAYLNMSMSPGTQQEERPLPDMTVDDVLDEFKHLAVAPTLPADPVSEEQQNARAEELEQERDALQREVDALRQQLTESQIAEEKRDSTAAQELAATAAQLSTANDSLAACQNALVTVEHLVEDLCKTAKVQPPTSPLPQERKQDTAAAGAAAPLSGPDAQQVVWRVERISEALMERVQSLQQQQTHARRSAAGDTASGAAAMATPSAATNTTTTTTTMIASSSDGFDSGQSGAGRDELPRISFQGLGPGDLVLFLPAAPGSRPNTYLAFNRGCPHRYLSPASLELMDKEAGYPAYVMGRVVLVEQHTAMSDGAKRGGDAAGRSSSGGGSDNPYRLPRGTEFFELTVEDMHCGPPLPSGLGRKSSTGGRSSSSSGASGSGLRGSRG